MVLYVVPTGLLCLVMFAAVVLCWHSFIVVMMEDRNTKCEILFAVESATRSRHQPKFRKNLGMYVRMTNIPYLLPFLPTGKFLRTYRIHKKIHPRASPEKSCRVKKRIRKLVSLYAVCDHCRGRQILEAVNQVRRFADKPTTTS